MDEYLAKGYAHKVPEEEVDHNDGKVVLYTAQWCLHPTKGKLRVVFGCGVSYQGASLNSQLLQGRDLKSSLIGVITRFRKEPDVIMQDIQPMFHQVMIPAEDKVLLVNK